LRVANDLQLKKNLHSTLTTKPESRHKKTDEMSLTVHHIA